MPIRHASLLAAVLTTLAACATLLHREAAPHASWPHETSDLPPDPAVVYGRLPNGLRYAILENDTPSGVGALRLRIDAGSLMEDDDQRGLAHVLEHMAFNGSANVPEGEMVRMLERAGLAFGPDTNAYTSVDETVYQLDLPSVSDETLETAFFLLDEVAQHLLIDPDALERERGVVLSEMRVRNTYTQRYREAAQAFLYPGARFVERDPIGVAEVLRDAPAERVRDFYEAYYRPERALVVFVGDAPAEAIEARIRETFGDWRARGPDGDDPDVGEVRDLDLAADAFVDPDMPTVVTIAETRPAASETDTVETRRDRLVRNLGFAMLSRRLQRLARAPDAPFLSASASYARVYDTLEHADISIVAETGGWSTALAAGEQELRRALDHGFSEAELAEQLAVYRASLRAAADGAETRRSSGLADGLVGSVGSSWVFTHPSTDLARFEALAADVTVEDVEAAFADAWGDREPAIFLGAASGVEGGPRAIATAFLDSRATAVSAAPERGDSAFAYDDFGAPGAVLERRRAEDLDVTEVRFANNVRLNVKPTDFARDRVSVSVRVGAGRLEMPKELPGLEYLAESTLISAGLGEHSIDDLQSLLAGENVGVDFFVDDDAFVFSAVATPEDLALQLKLFAAYVAEPGYREEALTRYRRSLDAWYESIDATPQGVQARDVPRLLRSGDPRYGVPDRDALGARTFDEMRAALEAAFASGAVEVGVVGDVEVDAAIDAVAESFGALAQRAAEPPTLEDARVVRFPEPTAEQVVLGHRGEKDRALALVYWPGVDGSDVERTRVLTLAKEVLQLKLTERVREKDGASYSPSAFASFSDVSPGYGYIGVSLDVEPDLVEGYFEAVDEIVESMAAGDVTEDEIERARRPLLADIEQAGESNRYWLRVVSIAQTKPQVLDDHRTRRAGFAAITRTDVIEAAQRYFRADRAFRIAITPEPESEELLAAAGARDLGAVADAGPPELD